MRRRVVAGLATACVLALAGIVAVRATSGSLPRPQAAGAEPTTTEEPTFAPGTTPPTSETTTTTLPPTTTTVAPTTTTTAAPRPVHDLTVYSGLGTWADVYDWSDAFNQGTAKLTTADIDRMAAEGVQTLYIQTSKSEAPTDVLEPQHLQPLINRAKADHLSVVAWYLPTFENEPLDLQRLIAAANIKGVDSVAVDIESEKVQDVGERNRRLLALTAGLRSALPKMTLGGIVYPPIVTDVLNQNIWPNFPWTQLAPVYDVWLPMDYQSFRSAQSPYRNAYRYTTENIDRLRAHLGLPHAPVHAIGGIADQTSPADVADMLRGAVQRQALGGSLYDYRTTGANLWPGLRSFRRR